MKGEESACENDDDDSERSRSNIMQSENSTYIYTRRGAPHFLSSLMLAQHTRLFTSG